MTDAIIGEPAGISEVRDYDGLIEAFRARKAELGLTDAALNTLANLGGGHIGKLFGDARVKILGPHSLNNILWALAVKIVIVEDPEARADLEQHWEKRERPIVDAQRRAKLGKTTMRRVIPAVMSELGKRGAAVTNALKTKKQRSVAAKRAADARWSRIPYWKRIPAKRSPSA